METFLVMAALYFVFMMAGAFGYRVPPSGWTPAGWTAPVASNNAMITANHVHVKKVWGIPQFWLLWGVLCLNVSAGIGVIGMSSPMLQEVFGGRLIGVDAGFGSLDAAQLASIAAIAAGFTGLLSLFNIGGRFFWASMSDKLGRKNTYTLFFLLGICLYAAAPSAGGVGGIALFVGIFCIILSMYGGGFATIPAYLADLFGTRWSAPSTAACSPPGPLPASSARWWWATCASTSWRTAARRHRSTTPPCTSSPACSCLV